MDIKEYHRPAYLHVAQPVTIKSMLNAKGKRSNIELLYCKHKNDLIKIRDFQKEVTIDRYNYDVIGSLPKQGNLPLIKDILNQALKGSDADFFIYTNTDIGVFPHFYKFIEEKVKSGLDGFIINRRTMPKVINGEKIDQYNYEKVFASKGERHNGIDCAVFRRPEVEALDDLGDIYLGAAPIGCVLWYWMQKHYANLEWLKDEVKTFHLGDDLAWRNQGSQELLTTNMKIGQNLKLGDEFAEIINQSDLV